MAVLRAFREASLADQRLAGAEGCRPFAAAIRHGSLLLRIFFRILVNRLEILRRWLRAWARKHRVQLALTLRMTVAAVAGLGLAQALSLPLPLWTVLTALIVTQMSIGRSLKTSIDYFVGTVGGTIYGAALALLIPHDNELALLL